MTSFLRVAILTFVSSLLYAANPNAWVPARWEGGPLEVARRLRANLKPAPDVLTAIHDWYTSRTLDLLKDTPINCLIVTWSIGTDRAAEQEQQKLVADYVNRAHERHIAVLGSVHNGADLERALGAARTAGLDGLVLEEDFTTPATPANSGFVIPLGARAWLSPGNNWPVLGTSDAVTARIVITSDSGAVMATTSSEPWIASNTWLVNSLRGRRAQPVWLGHMLDNPSNADYLRAIADASAAGGRWAVALDDVLKCGLWRGNAAAIASWRGIGEALAFFEQHDDWQAFAPIATLGIIDDPTAAQHEYLNLVTRRRIPYRIIDRAKLSSEHLNGLSTVLALAPPSAAERKLLTAFAEKGGLVVGGPAWSTVPPTKSEYGTVSVGAGRVVVYAEESPDPESVARDLVDLIGYENMPVRLFNVASVLSHASADAAGTRLLVQLVNYATSASDDITVRVRPGYQRARIFRPGVAPAELKLAQAGQNVEVRVSNVAVCAALLFEK